MSQKNENLERLLQQFVDPSQAGSIADDIQYADTVFDAHPVPSAPAESRIRAMQNVRTQLALSKRHHIQIRWASAAVAVLVLVGMWLIYTGVETMTPLSPYPDARQQVTLEGFYTSGLSAADIEKDISDLDQAIENINDRSIDPVDSLQLNLNEIEDQLIANNTEFWKG